MTTPPELPIMGDPFTEIVLDLVFPKGRTLFILNGKKLQLLEPLDRDAENISHVVFQVIHHFYFTKTTDLFLIIKSDLLSLYPI